MSDEENNQRNTSFDNNNYSDRETSLINERDTCFEKDSATSIIQNSFTKIDFQDDTINFDSEKLIGMTLQGENGQYLIEKLLTKAGESKIFICKKDDKQYIAKVYIGTITLNKEKRKAFIDLLYHQSNASILSLEDYGFYDDMPFDIYPYMKNGDISKADLSLDFIHDTLIPNLNEVLYFIHGKGVIHRDIKPQNILFSDDKQSIKITDFGILSIADGTSSITSTHRTNGYAAPEIYTGVADYESDYYAMGITLLSVLIHGDVFEGYPEEQIMRNTIYGTIPHLNRKKLSVSEMTLKDRIEGLICGLTIIDIKKRWGYEQVKKWCEGQLHFPDDLEQEEEREFEKPFIWEGERCYTAVSMAAALSKNWEKSKRESGRGLFADWLKFYRPDIASDLYYLIENSKWRSDIEKDIGLFKVIYTIDPNIKGFHWKGNIFTNFSELAEHLQGEKDSSFEQLLLTGGFSWYFKRIEKQYTISEQLKKTVAELESFIKFDMLEGYQRFIFQFLPKDAPRSFKILGMSFKDIEELVSKLPELEPLEKNAQTILSSPMFSAWIWYFGYDDLLKKAKVDLGKLSLKMMKERFFILLEQCTKQPEILRKIAIEQEKEYKPIIWLKENLYKYTYFTEESKILKAIFENIMINETIPLKENYSNLRELSDAYVKFAEKTYKNAYKFHFGLISKNDFINILPLYSGAYFIKIGERFLPVEYVLKSEISANVIEQMEPQKQQAEQALLQVKNKFKSDFHKLEVTLMLPKRTFEKQIDDFDKIHINSDEKFKAWLEKIKKEASRPQEKSNFYSPYPISCFLTGIFLLVLGIYYLFAWPNYWFCSLAFFACCVYPLNPLLFEIMNKTKKEEEKREEILTAINSLKEQVFQYLYNVKKVNLQLQSYYSSFQNEVSNQSTTFAKATELFEETQNFYQSNAVKRKEFGFRTFLLGVPMLLFLLIAQSIAENIDNPSILICIIIIAFMWLSIYGSSLEGQNTKQTETQETKNSTNENDTNSQQHTTQNNSSQQSQSPNENTTDGSNEISGAIIIISVVICLIPFLIKLIEQLIGLLIFIFICYVCSQSSDSK